MITSVSPTASAQFEIVFRRQPPRTLFPVKSFSRHGFEVAQHGSEEDHLAREGLLAPLEHGAGR